MPKSRSGRRPPTRRRPTTGASKPVKVKGPTHPVYIAVMLGLMLAGLAWLVVNYLAGDVDPVHGRARLVELPDRLLAHRDRPADDHAVALTPNQSSPAVDNSCGQLGMTAPREWSPAAGLVVCGWVARWRRRPGSCCLGRPRPDPAGRLLAGVAAVGLRGRAFGTRARPRLRADPDGLTVGGLSRARHYPWPLVQDVRVLQVRRLGRRSSLLELDTVTADGDERLLVFGRLDLAEDPEDVAPQVLALRPTRGP